MVQVVVSHLMYYHRHHIHYVMYIEMWPKVVELASDLLIVKAIRPTMSGCYLSGCHASACSSQQGNESLPFWRIGEKQSWPQPP